MQHKSELQHISMNFVKFDQTQFHTTIKIVRSDNGTEFVSLQSFFTYCGIEIHHTCVYTLQQNGVVERKHRHILNAARSLLFQSLVPLNFWGMCILTIVHLINRISSTLLSNKTPFEAPYKRRPTLLNVFFAVNVMQL